MIKNIGRNLNIFQLFCLLLHPVWAQGYFSGYETFRAIQTLKEGSINKLKERVSHIENQLNIKPNIPQDQPHKIDLEILLWAVDSVVELYSLDYIHHEKTIEKSRNLFSKNGHKHYLNTLKQFEILPLIQKNHLVVRAEPKEPPMLFMNRINSLGIYSWQVKVPLSIQMLEKGKLKKEITTDLVLLIIHSKEANNPEDLSIIRLQAS